MQHEKPERWPPEREELSQVILEYSPDFMGLLDSAGRFLMINEAGRNLLEVDDVSAARGKDWRLLWPESARPQVDIAVATANSGGESRFREWCPTAKGELRLGTSTVTPSAGPERQARPL